MSPWVIIINILVNFFFHEGLCERVFYFSPKSTLIVTEEPFSLGGVLQILLQIRIQFKSNNLSQLEFDRVLILIFDQDHVGIQVFELQTSDVTTLYAIFLVPILDIRVSPPL